MLIQNIYSSICGTDVAVYKHGANTGHKVTVGGEFGHEMISRVVKVGKNITDFKVGDRVYPYPRYAKDDTRRAGTLGGFSEYIQVINAILDHSLYFVPESISDKVACLIELVFEICNTGRADFKTEALRYFGEAYSPFGTAVNADIFLDAAGAESILDTFIELGTIGSRFVSVAVNKAMRSVDLLHMTYAQQSIIGSGGYFPEDVRDVLSIMSSGKWDIEKIITHEFPIDDISKGIETAADTDHAFNVINDFGIAK